jgi:hypothetical protein
VIQRENFDVGATRQMCNRVRTDRETAARAATNALLELAAALREECALGERLARDDETLPAVYLPQPTVSETMALVWAAHLIGLSQVESQDRLQ